jgi:hypothetical protein
MELEIRDTTYSIIAIIDNATSILWTKKYNDVGEFEFVVPAAIIEYIKALQVNYYVTRPDENQVGIIERINRKADFENGDYYIINGRFIESILDRRIVWEQTIFSGTVENAIRKFINDNAINPEIPERKLPNLILESVHGWAEPLTIQRTGTGLSDLTSDLCKQFNYGFRITRLGNNFIFGLYKGIDRSYGQTVNPYVVFSEEFDNLNGQEYICSLEEFKNVAQVAGEGEGSARVRTVVGKGAGMARFEVFVDAHDLSTNDGEVPMNTYLEQLKTRGRDRLIGITELFDADIITSATYEYKVDYNVGDIVTIASDEWGIMLNTRLIAMTESWNEEGYKLVPTFAQ